MELKDVKRDKGDRMLKDCDKNLNRILLQKKYENHPRRSQDEIDNPKSSITGILKKNITA